MELETFLEKDIENFLDISTSGVAQPPSKVRQEEIGAYELTKDYSKEVDQALADANILKAKNVFFELKKEFESFPEGSEDKKKAFDIMKEVKGKIEKYEFGPKEAPLPSKDTAEKPKEKKRSFIPDFGSFIRKKKVKPEDIPEPPVKEEKTPESFPVAQNKEPAGEHEVATRLEKLHALIELKKVREALTLYDETKKMFTQMDAPKERKEEMMKDLMALYRSLRDLEHYMEEKHHRAPPQQVIKPPEKKSLEESINNAKLKAYKYLDNEEANSAIMQYNKLKELEQRIPPSNHDLKERTRREMLDLHDRIVKAKRNHIKHLVGHGEIAIKVNVKSKSWDDVKTIKEMIESDNLDGAKAKFLELQHDAVKVSDENDRKELFQAMDAIKNKIHLATVSHNISKND